MLVSRLRAKYSRSFCGKGINNDRGVNSAKLGSLCSLERNNDDGNVEELGQHHCKFQTSF